MPILATPLVNETSVKTGDDDGNEAPTATLPGTPLIEILASVTFAASDFDPIFISVEGVLPGLGFWVEAGFDDVDVVAEAQPVAAVPLESPVQSVICWLNGSLLLNLLNETS
jgi:hypothetical protein